MNNYIDLTKVSDKALAEIVRLLQEPDCDAPTDYRRYVQVELDRRGWKDSTNK